MVAQNLQNVIQISKLFGSAPYSGQSSLT